MNEELKRYIPIANMVAKTFGENCQAVICDLSSPEVVIVYAVNHHGPVSQPELSFEHLLRDLLVHKDVAHDYKANYFAGTGDKRWIKSSAALIRNIHGQIIGALCIQFDIKQMQEMESFLREFLAVEEDEGKDAELFGHVMEMVDELIDQVIATVDVMRMKRREKIELIRIMDRKGIFLMKGSVEKIAEKLNISKVTVYSYLDEIKKNVRAKES